MNKLFIKILALIGILLMTTGCFYDEGFETNDTYTTLYPIEYITNELYGDKSNVYSIYPNGADVNTYKLTKKQTEEYAKSNMFIYNGIGKEKNIAVDFLNLNKNIQIIDAMQGMNYEYSEEELWLDPSNFLMIAQNIKNGLLQYNEDISGKDELDEKYEEFKIKISEIDVELNLISKNADSTTIVVSDDLFKFLTKYNIDVISLDNKNKNVNKEYAEAKRAIASGEVSYIITKKGEKLNSNIEDFIASNKVEKLEMEMLYNLTDEQKSAGEDYVSLMNKNIENLKTELFD